MRTGFTLVELLVVITIIVVLMALLAPAMDRAIYQAELAACGANLKTIGSGTLLYATQNQRTYPHRGTQSASSHATQISLNAENGPRDDRPYLNAYVPFDTLYDPLAGKVDFDPAVTVNNAVCVATYALWFGRRYIDTPGQKRMRRIGDRFTWQGVPKYEPDARELSFNLLVSDQDAYSHPFYGNMLSHPDKDGLNYLVTLQNEYAQAETIPGTDLQRGFIYVFSRWNCANTARRRGLYDYQYLLDDGGMRRIEDVQWDETDRVTSIPVPSDGPGQFDYWQHMPRQ